VTKADLRKCPDCGKIFAAHPGKARCLVCTTHYLQESALVEYAIAQLELDTPEVIAEFLGIPEDRVRQCIRDSSLLSAQAPVEAPCSRCGRAPATGRGRFCTDCLIDLDKAFRDAAGAVEKRLETMPSPLKGSRTGMLKALLDKRGRAGFRRFDPTPKGRY